MPISGTGNIESNFCYTEVKRTEPNKCASPGAWEQLEIKNMIYITSIASCNYLWEINDPDAGDTSFVEVTSGKVSTIKVDETIYDLLVRPGNKLTFYSLGEDEIHNEYKISIIQTLTFDRGVNFAADSCLFQSTTLARGFIKGKLGSNFAVYDVHVITVPALFQTAGTVEQVFNEHTVQFWTNNVVRGAFKNFIYFRQGQFRLRRNSTISDCIDFMDINHRSQNLLNTLKKTFPDVHHVSVNFTSLANASFVTESIGNYFPTMR